jgi:hypothetical protein
MFCCEIQTSRKTTIHKLFSYSNTNEQPTKIEEKQPIADESSDSGWSLGSIWSSVKAKSAVVVDIYARDLKEFKDTVTTDTTVVLKKNVNQEDGSITKVVGEKIAKTVETLANVANEALLQDDGT